MQSFDALLQRTLGLRAALEHASRERASDAVALERDLEDAAEVWLAGGTDADEIFVGTHLARAAIDAGLAGRALAKLADYEGVRLARRYLSEALVALAPLEGLEPGPARLASCPRVRARPEPSSTVGAAGASQAAESTASWTVLHDIATFHRAHERYYTQHLSEAASDLYREANRLRIIADVWLAADEQPPRPDVDFGDARYRVAGCHDLNALAAIPAIGILFMEGEGEPSEIRALKGKLRAVSSAFQASGQWLAARIEPAWGREQSLMTVALVDAARPRFDTIATNWTGSREIVLSGRLLGIAASRLERGDFRPSAVRSARRAAGLDLLHTAWIVGMAAQLCARFAANLADNDRPWTAYMRVLEGALEAGVESRCS
jgi:hypothetical protein